MVSGPVSRQCRGLGRSRGGPDGVLGVSWAGPGRLPPARGREEGGMGGMPAPTATRATAPPSNDEESESRHVPPLWRLRSVSVPEATNPPAPIWVCPGCEIAVQVFPFPVCFFWGEKRFPAPPEGPHPPWSPHQCRDVFMIVCVRSSNAGRRTHTPPRAAPQTTRWLNVANGRHRIARPKSNCQRLRRRISTANH